METLNITLTKKRNYILQPYGKFALKWKTRQAHIPNIIPVDELSFNNEEGMPIEDENDKAVIKMMKKHKTDILTDGYGTYYTRIGVGCCSVQHEKLSRYATDPAFKNAVDLGHSFGRIMLNNA
ncbi:MAG: hypothetical protein WC341_15740 [Bacteroidales bacterium]|jgi:hypothetical protein